VSNASPESPALIRYTPDVNHLTHSRQVRVPQGSEAHSHTGDLRGTARDFLRRLDRAVPPNNSKPPQPQENGAISMKPEPPQGVTIRSSNGHNIPCIMTREPEFDREDVYAWRANPVTGRRLPVARMWSIRIEECPLNALLVADLPMPPGERQSYTFIEPAGES
jgi:hypothetical protein